MHLGMAALNRRPALVDGAHLRRGAPPLLDRERRADQSHMREGLRYVPQRFPRAGVDFLGEDAEVVRVGKESREPFLRLVEASAAPGQVLRGPEAANSKCAFSRCTTIL